jgi:4-hydroxybenzoate polyprenyltransferase
MIFPSIYTIIRLIRLPNLLIVAATQFFIYSLLLLPSLQEYAIEPILDKPHFVLFVVVTILITIMGYVINDIRDVESDRLNKPNKAIIDIHISTQSAFRLYYSIFVVGLIMAFYLAWHVNNLLLVGIYPLAVGLLHLYSTHLKQKVLVGNTLVSLFCAGVAGIVLFAEREAINDLLQYNPMLGRQVLFILSWYMVFAFLSTMYREVIKDLEDLKGDSQQQCTTLPIVYGVKKTKAVAITMGISLMLMIFLSMIQEYLPFSLAGVIMVIILVMVPLAISFLLLYKAQKKKEYHQISQLVKLIMVGGIMLLFTMILAVDL